MIEFKKNSDINELKKKIENALEKILHNKEAIYNNQLKETCLKFEKSNKLIIDFIKELMKKTNKRSESDGFEIKISLPNLSRIESNISISKTIDNVVKTTNIPDRRRQKGLWGAICEFFGTTDWGWEEYQDEQYQIRCIETKEKINEQIEKKFSEKKELICNIISNDSLGKIFNEPIEKIKEINGDLRESIQDKNLDQEQKKRLFKKLGELRAKTPNIAKDSKSLKGDIEFLIQQQK